MTTKKTKVSTNEEIKKKTTATKTTVKKKKTEEAVVTKEAPKKKATTAKKSAAKAVEEVKTEEVVSKPVEEVKETPIEKKEVAISVVEKKVSDLNFAYHDPFGKLPNEFRSDFPDRLTDMFVPYSMIFSCNSDKFKSLVAGGNYYCYCKYDHASQTPSDNYEIIKAYMNFCIEHGVKTHVVIVDELFNDANSSIAIDLIKVLLHKFRFAFTDIIATNDINKLVNAYDFGRTGNSSIAGYIPIKNNTGQVLDVFVGYSVGFKA